MDATSGVINIPYVYKALFSYEEHELSNLPDLRFEGYLLLRLPEKKS